MRRQQIDVVSPKKSWLRPRLLCIAEIAETHAHEPVALLGAEIDSVSQFQGYLCQSITGSKRMVISRRRKLRDETVGRACSQTTMPLFQTSKCPTERLPREVPANYPTWRRET